MYKILLEINVSYVHTDEIKVEKNDYEAEITRTRENYHKSTQLIL